MTRVTYAVGELSSHWRVRVFGIWTAALSLRQKQSVAVDLYLFLGDLWPGLDCWFRGS